VNPCPISYWATGLVKKHSSKNDIICSLLPCYPAPLLPCSPTAPTTSWSEHVFWAGDRQLVSSQGVGASPQGGRQPLFYKDFGSLELGKCGVLHQVWRLPKSNNLSSIISPVMSLWGAKEAKRLERRRISIESILTSVWWRFFAPVGRSEWHN
jgi:hypothetical protein